MYKKVCIFCRGESYSSYNGRWICPYCGADLNAVKPQPAGRGNNNLKVCQELNTTSHRPREVLNTPLGNPVENSIEGSSHRQSARIYYLQPKKRKTPPRIWL